MTKIFVTPPKGTDLVGEFGRLGAASIHNEDLYGEEGEAHGGEKVNSATGRPSVNKKAPVIGPEALMSERDINTGGDIMGNIKDPNKMSLEELMKTQKD